MLLSNMYAAKIYNPQKKRLDMPTLIQALSRPVQIRDLAQQLS